MDNLRQELSTVTSRLQKTMSKREVIFDIAYRELAKLRKSLKDSDDQSQYYSSTLENVIHSAAHADKKQLDFLRKNLPSIGKEIDYAVDVVNRPTVKRMLNVVISTLDKAGPGDVREKFGNVKRGLRDDLLSSMFGDTVGGFVGDAIDRRREKKSNQKTFERNHLAERRSHLDNILDNVGLEKKSSAVNKPKVGRRGSNQNPPPLENKVAPPPILDTITPMAPPKVKKTDIPAPPPIVMKNGVVTPAGDADLAEKIKPTRGRKRKTQVSDDVLNDEKSRVKEQEFREEQENLLKEELQLLEKIEVNTRETAAKAEKQRKDNDSQGILSGLLGASGTIANLAKTLAPFLPQIVLAAGALKIAYDGYQLASDDKTVGKSKSIGTGKGTGSGDPKDLSFTDRSLTFAGSALSELNPINAYKRMTGEMTEDQSKQQRIDMGTGLQNIFNGNSAPPMNEAEEYLLKTRGPEYLEKVRNRNKQPIDLAKEAELKTIKPDTFGMKGVQSTTPNGQKGNASQPSVFDEKKGLTDTLKKAIPTFPKNVFDVSKLPFEGPKMDNLRKAYRKVQPSIDTFLGKTNPVRAVNRGIQRMLGFSDSEKQNIGLIKEELAEKGFDEKQILSILSVAQKESQFQPIEENLKGYANTKDNDYIRRVFKSIDKDGKDIPGGRLTKAKYSDAELEKLKKDTPRFTEAVYGKDTSIAKSLGNTEEGDAWKFRGRGFIQLTGKKNYKDASQAIFNDERLLKNPDLALDPKVAAKITAWFVKRGSQWIAKPKTNSQEDLNRFFTSVVNGSNINTSDPKSHHTKMFNEVNSNSNNPVLQEMAAIPGKKLSAAASVFNAPAPVQQPMIVDARTSVVNSGGGSSGGSAGIPNVRNEESSFKRINQNSARNN